MQVFLSPTFLPGLYRCLENKRREKKKTFQFSSTGLCMNAAKFSYQSFFQSWRADLTNSVCRNMSVLLVCLTETRLVSNWNPFVFPPACLLTSPGSLSVWLPPKRNFPACLGTYCTLPFKIHSRVPCLSQTTLSRLDFSSHSHVKFFRRVKYSLPLKQFLTKCRKESVKLMWSRTAKAYRETPHLNI